MTANGTSAAAEIANGFGAVTDPKRVHALTAPRTFGRSRSYAEHRSFSPIAFHFVMNKLVLTITGIIYSDYRLTGDTSTDQVEWSRMEYIYCTNAVSK